MAPPKVDEKSCNINCNYLGGSSKQICAQLDEFNQGLESPLISVAPDSQDDNYCAYQSVASGEIIKPVAFQNGYYLLKGTVWPEGDYLYFRMGEVPKEVEEKFRSRLQNNEGGYQIAAYHVLVKNDSGRTPSADAYQLEETAIHYLNTEFGSEIIDYYSMPVGKGNGRLEYRLYVAGYNLPEAFPQSLEKEIRPPLKFAHCPEWVQHQSQVKSEVPIAGWALTQKPQGKLLAIPREELKGEISGRLNAAEQYAYDLRSRLGLNEYMKGDNPIRLLKGIQFVGDSGVVGLACPQFEVTIDEIAKREDNCLEWVERWKEADVRRGNRVTDFEDGYLMAQTAGIYRYITATGKADLKGARAQVAKMEPRLKGYKTRVYAEPLVEDPVCSAYQVYIQYEKIPEPKLAPPVTTIKPLPKGIGDKEKLLERFKDNPGVQRKLRQLGELGEITWAPPVGKEPGKNVDLITVIKRKIHEKEKKPRLEVMLAVDGSGSMKDDTRLVRDKLEDVVAEMKTSADEGGMGLLGFVNDQSPLLVSLDSAKPLEAYIPDMKAGLTHIDQKMDGRLEYIYEAAKKTLDHLELSGEKGSVQKILLLTDEAGDIKDGGETLKSIRQRADRLGMKFEIIFIADARGMKGLQVFLQYLDMAGINPGAMAQEERMKLWEKMLNDSSLASSVKIIVCEKVAQEKHAGSPQILAQALKDSNWDVRLAAAENLGKLNDPRGIPALLEALKDADWHVRLAAAENLGKLNDPRGIPVLLEALKDSDWYVRQTAAKSLGKLNDPRMVPVLLEALKDADWHVRLAAAESLGNQNDPRAVPALLKVLKDSDRYVRRAAARSLGNQNDPRAVPALLEALKDSEWGVRHAAAESLGKQNDPRGIPALLEALKDSNWDVRQAAAKSLGKLNDPRGVPVLLEALKDADWYVRQVTAESLGQIGTSDVIPHLSPLLFDPDSDVIQAASEAIEAIQAREGVEQKGEESE